MYNLAAVALAQVQPGTLSSLISLSCTFHGFQTPLGQLECRAWKVARMFLIFMLGQRQGQGPPGGRLVGAVEDGHGGWVGVGCPCIMELSMFPLPALHAADLEYNLQIPSASLPFRLSGWSFPTARDGW